MLVLLGSDGVLFRNDVIAMSSYRELSADIFRDFTAPDACNGVALLGQHYAPSSEQPSSVISDLLKLLESGTHSHVQIRPYYLIFVCSVTYRLL